MTQRVSGAPPTRDLATDRSASGKIPDLRRIIGMLRRVRDDG